MVAVGTVAVAVVPSVNGDAITIAVSPAANPGNTNVVSAAPLIMVLIAADISTGVPGIVSVWAAAGISTDLGVSIVGVEALIRWQTPQGLVPPMQFIPLLEETGLIVQAGAWALKRAALDHRGWSEQGIAAPRIAVNVSAIQLRGDTAMSMGNVILTDKNGKVTTVDKTWAYARDDKGALRIILHHSSLPVTSH